MICSAPTSSAPVDPKGKGNNPPAGPKTPEEKSFWSRASPWVHGVLGVANFVPGLSVVTGTVDAAIYVGEGNIAEAGLSIVSAVPFGKEVLRHI